MALEPERRIHGNLHLPEQVFGTNTVTFEGLIFQHSNRPFTIELDKLLAGIDVPRCQIKARTDTGRLPLPDSYDVALVFFFDEFKIKENTFDQALIHKFGISSVEQSERLIKSLAIDQGFSVQFAMASKGTITDRLILTKRFAADSAHRSSASGDENVRAFFDAVNLILRTIAAPHRFQPFPGANPAQYLQTLELCVATLLGTVRVPTDNSPAFSVQNGNVGMSLSVCGLTRLARTLGTPFQMETALQWTNACLEKSTGKVHVKASENETIQVQVRTSTNRLSDPVELRALLKGTAQQFINTAAALIVCAYEKIPFDPNISEARIQTNKWLAQASMDSALRIKQDLRELEIPWQLGSPLRPSFEETGKRVGKIVAGRASLRVPIAEKFYDHLERTGRLDILSRLFNDAFEHMLLQTQGSDCECSVTSVPPSDSNGKNTDSAYWNVAVAYDARNREQRLAAQRLFLMKYYFALHTGLDIEESHLFI